MDAGRKRELEAKVYAGERLTREDGVALYESDDLAWLGRLAHHKRTELNGERVMFNVNRHLNLTNVCSASCAYCAFRRKPGEKDASVMSVDEVVRRAREMADEQLTELHVVNGLPPAALRELKAALPDVKLHCFTATEIQQLEKAGGRSASEILDELVDAGLESLTSGGTEIFDHDTNWEDWSRIHRVAHDKGMKTQATMLYGHDEEPRHRVDHVIRLREMQDETGGFAVFIPLRYEHGDRTPAAPAASLKTFAVSRLMFDNVPHVKSLWAMHGLSVAQLTLNFGADDLDGSVVDHKITPDADSYAVPHAVHRDNLLELIWDAGFQPVERDARYAAVREYDPAPSLASRRAEPATVWA
jgi:aminodeoxyfutalosine synthase